MRCARTRRRKSTGTPNSFGEVSTSAPKRPPTVRCLASHASTASVSWNSPPRGSTQYPAPRPRSTEAAAGAAHRASPRASNAARTRRAGMAIPPGAEAATATDGHELAPGASRARTGGPVDVGPMGSDVRRRDRSDPGAHRAGGHLASELLAGPPHLLLGQGLHVRGEAPRVPERIHDGGDAVAPELVGGLAGPPGARLDGAPVGGVAVRDVEPHPHRGRVFR